MTDESSSSPPEKTPEQQEVPLAYRAVRSGLWVTSASYWSIGFGFFANIVLTRTLTPDAYGDFALATFFFLLLQLRGKLSLPYAFAQLPEGDDAAMGTYVTVDVGLGITGLALILLAAIPLLYLGYSTVVVGMTIVMAVVSVIESFGSVFVAVLSKHLWSKPGSVIFGISLPLSYIPAFWLASIGKGSWSLIAQYVSMILIAQVGLWLFVVFSLRLTIRFEWKFKKDTMRRLVTFGGIVGLSAFIGTMGSQVDNFYLGTFSSTEALGFYDRAFRTAQWPTLLLSALIANSAYFTYSRLQSDSVRLQKTVSMMFWISANLAFPIALVLFISAPDLITAAYGERWLPAAPLLRVLVIVSVIRPLWDNASALFTAVGQPSRMIIMLSVQLVVLVIVGWPLTVLYGGMGTALAMCISFFCGLIPLYLSLGRIIQPGTIMVYALPALAAVLTVISYVLLTQFVQLDSINIWLRLATKIVYTLVAFFGLMWLLQPRETNQRLAYIVRLIRS